MQENSIQFPDYFLSPITVSDWFTICCTSSIHVQSQKGNESDKKTNLLMKNNKKQMAKQYMQI